MNRWFEWSEKGWRRYLGPDLVIPLIFTVCAFTAMGVLMK